MQRIYGRYHIFFMNEHPDRRMAVGRLQNRNAFIRKCGDDFDVTPGTPIIPAPTADTFAQLSVTVGSYPNSAKMLRAASVLLPATVYTISLGVMLKKSTLIPAFAIALKTSV